MYTAATFKVVVHNFMHYSCMYLVISISQLSSRSTWSSKGTVQVSSTSSVDMMLFVLTQDRTVEDGELFATAFPGLTMYSFQNSTEHRVTVTGRENVTALDGYVFQCLYSIGGTPIESNAEQYSFVPNGQLQYTVSLIIQ